jgi:hypothetical protein
VDLARAYIDLHRRLTGLAFSAQVGPVAARILASLRDHGYFSSTPA